MNNSPLPNRWVYLARVVPLWALLSSAYVGQAFGQAPPPPATSCCRV